MPRILPDLVSVGVAYSAKALNGTECGGHCDDHSDVIFMGGTSMATPATAGAVAVIQQYLNEGGYIKLRDIEFHGEVSDLADAELHSLEAKLTARGIAFLNGKVSDPCIRR